MSAPKTQLLPDELEPHVASGSVTIAECAGVFAMRELERIRDAVCQAAARQGNELPDLEELTVLHDIMRDALAKTKGAFARIRHPRLTQAEPAEPDTADAWKE